MADELVEASEVLQEAGHRLLNRREDVAPCRHAGLAGPRRRLPARLAALAGPQGERPEEASVALVKGDQERRELAHVVCEDPSGVELADQAGLAPSQLVDGTDLAVTTDYRQVLSEILLERLGNPHLDAVFPGYTGYQPLGVIAGSSLPSAVFSDGFESGDLGAWNVSS